MGEGASLEKSRAIERGKDGGTGVIACERQARGVVRTLLDMYAADPEERKRWLRCWPRNKVASSQEDNKKFKKDQGASCGEVGHWAREGPRKSNRKESQHVLAVEAGEESD